MQSRSHSIIVILSRLREIRIVVIMARTSAVGLLFVIIVEIGILPLIAPSSSPFQREKPADQQTRAHDHAFHEREAIGIQIILQPLSNAGPKQRAQN